MGSCIFLSSLLNYLAVSLWNRVLDKKHFRVGTPCGCNSLCSFFHYFIVQIPRRVSRIWRQTEQLLWSVKNYPQRTQANYLLMGSARGNEALGLAGRPGAVTFPESSRGSLTAAAGGMSCFPQGQHRIIHSVRPAPFSRHQQQLPGGQGKRGGEHTRRVYSFAGQLSIPTPLTGLPPRGALNPD